MKIKFKLLYYKIILKNFTQIKNYENGPKDDRRGGSYW